MKKITFMLLAIILVVLLFGFITPFLIISSLRQQFQSAEPQTVQERGAQEPAETTAQKLAEMESLCSSTYGTWYARVWNFDKTKYSLQEETFGYWLSDGNYYYCSCAYRWLYPKGCIQNTTNMHRDAEDRHIFVDYASNEIRVNYTFYYNTSAYTNNFVYEAPVAYYDYTNETNYILDIGSASDKKGNINVRKEGQKIIFTTHYGKEGMQPVYVVMSGPLQKNISGRMIRYYNLLPPASQVLRANLVHLIADKDKAGTLEIRWEKPIVFYTNAKQYSVGDNFLIVNISSFNGSPQMLLIKNVSSLGVWKFAETDKHYIVAPAACLEIIVESSKKAAEDFHRIESITGLKTPYERHLIVLDEEAGTTFYAGAGLTVFNACPDVDVSADITHEAIHSFNEQFNVPYWFNEGTATYLPYLIRKQKGTLVVPYFIGESEYDFIKEFYKSGRVVNGSTFVTMEHNMDIYFYGTFVVGNYVNEYGPEALRRFYSILDSERIEKQCRPIAELDSWGADKKKTNQAYDPDCISDTVADILAEAAGKNLTRSDILYPYRDLLMQNEAEFEKKVLYMG